MPRKTDHVKMDAKQGCDLDDILNQKRRCRLQMSASMHCEHCGDRFPMPTGSLDWVIPVMNAFVKTHKNCQPDQKGKHGA